MTPRVVVLMSVFNEAAHLPETIPALLAQTMPDFRAVLLDNGSTDETWGMLQRYQDGRLTLIRAPRNMAPGKVANLLYGIASEFWLDCRWFLNGGADDVMAAEYLEAVCDAIVANPGANLIFSPWSYIGGVREPKRFPSYDPATMHAVHQLPAWHAFTRDLRAATGAQHETMIAADWDWLMRASVLGVLRPVQLERPYISLRVREGARKTQSDEVHWPTLHRHLCGLAGKPVPGWAR